MEIAGKLVKCDACENNVFLQQIEIGEWRDVYQDLPEGWLLIKGKQLCPDCSKKIREAQNEYEKAKQALFDEKEEKIRKLLEAL